MITSYDAQAELTGRYAEAMRQWKTHPAVRQAADTLGMNLREYCNRYVQQFGPITWTGTTTNPGSGLDWEAAYRAAWDAEQP